LFVKDDNGRLMIAQIYVDDIVFGGMSNKMAQHFIQQMQSEFEMSLVGKLTYFLGLQVKQMEDTIFISQSKYAKNIVKKFGMDNGGVILQILTSVLSLIFILSVFKTRFIRL